MRFGIAVLRAVIGGLFIGHGLQKLTGHFGGYGLEGTAQGFESLGLKPGKVHATAAGVAETAGGALLLTGAATPLAAGALSGTMAVAIKKVHLTNGPWAANNGYEYNLVLLAALFAITAAGPGVVSVDADSRAGTGWAVGEFALGLGAAAAILKFGDQGTQEGTGPVAQEPVETANGASQTSAPTTAG